MCRCLLAALPSWRSHAGAAHRSRPLPRMEPPDTPSVDAAIRREIASVDGLLNLLSAGTAPRPVAGCFAPAARCLEDAAAALAGGEEEEPLVDAWHLARGERAERAFRRDYAALEEPVVDLRQLARAERAERAFCKDYSALEASFVEARREVDRLSKRRETLERALGAARDEVGALRASQAALEAQSVCRGRQEETLRHQALQLRQDLKRCRDELSCQELTHMCELGELQEEVLELRGRMAAVRSELGDAGQGRTPKCPPAPRDPGCGGGACSGAPLAPPNDACRGVAQQPGHLGDPACGAAAPLQPVTLPGGGWGDAAAAARCGSSGPAERGIGATESAVLELCQLLDDGAAALPDPGELAACWAASWVPQEPAAATTAHTAPRMAALGRLASTATAVQLLLLGAILPGFAAGRAQVPGLSALQTAYSVRHSLPGAVRTAASASSISAAEAQEDMLLRIRYLESLAAKQSRKIAELQEELLGTAKEEPSPRLGSKASIAERLSALEVGLVGRTAVAQGLLARTKAAVERRTTEQKARRCGEPTCKCEV